MVGCFAADDALYYIKGVFLCQFVFTTKHGIKKDLFFLIFQISNSDVIEHGFWAADVLAVPARRIFCVLKLRNKM